MIGRLLAVLLVAAGILGCSPAAEHQGILGSLWSFEVGPGYHQPAAKPPPEFRSQITPAQAASLADLPWWKVFGDPKLQKLIAAALANNYDLQLAAGRVEQARAEVGVPASQLFPQIEYQGTAAREKSFVPLNQSQGNITFNTFAGLFNVAWELDIWGRIRRATEAARASLFAQEDVRRGVMLTLVSNVAAGYFNLLELKRELQIAQDSSQTYQRTLDLFTQRFRFGRANKLPVARARAAYDESMATIARLRRAIAQQENAISVLIGAYPQTIKTGIPLVAQTMPSSPVGLTTDLMQRRPDIQQSEQNMIRANALVGVAVADFFPRIGLSSLYGGQSQDITDMLDANFSIWNIAGNLAGPIFQGGRLFASYYAQQAAWHEAVAQYKQTVLGAFREVSDALIAQQTLADQRSALEGRVASLKEAVDLSLLRYQVGRASYFEVLEAEQLLFPAEDTLAQTERDQLLAVVDLYKALGGGWNLGDSQWMQPH